MTKPKESLQPLKPHQTALCIALVIGIVAYITPAIHDLFLPLQYLNTHVHELCHAIVAVATGGQVESITVRANASGVTPILGGNVPLEASAGYVGATLVGCAIIMIGHTPALAKTMMGALSVVLAISMILWVRGDAIGVLTGLLWVAALGMGARFLNGTAAVIACQIVGVQQCANALSSVYNVFQISVFTEAQSDAVLMQGYTHIPAAIWAAVWCGLSGVVILATVKQAWHRPKSSNESPSAGR